ncbi:MAG: preprotein translocase subunit SecE [Lachnospiraceae bacterium]|nr:preprotein translocase subunit SecE [Lachnospiraceae bacterium]
MGETKSADKDRKQSWFKGMKAEFKKIVWPTRSDLTKQTIAVVSVSVVLALLIKVLDIILSYGIDWILTL